MNLYPTLIVGIGGSGKLVCKFIKRYFAERFPRTWLSQATELPPIVSLLVIETEPGKEKEELSLTGLPDVPTITAYIDERTLKAMQSKEYKEKNPEIDRWLFSPLPIKAIIGGAGQIRQAGRLAFFRHRTAYGKIQKVITTAIENIKGDDAINLTIQHSQGKIEIKDRTPKCYLVSSVCGGTGSGMLMDIAGIINNAGVRTNLIAFLPKMFESNIDLPESVWQTYANTYAALKEINHYMTSGKWQVCYNESKKESVSIDKKIFDYCFLVDKESETVDLQDRLHISPLVAEFLFRMTSGLENRLHATAINSRRYIEAELPNWCNGLGVSIISFPLEEIREIMTNWGIRELVTRSLSLDFSQSEIEKTISDPNKGCLYFDFSYKNWEDALLDKNEYSPLSADTLIKRKASLENKVKDEKNRLRREYDDDVKRIREAYEKCLDNVKGRFIFLTNDILCTKGPEYFIAYVGKLKAGLHNISSALEDDQQKVNTSVTQLGARIEDNIKLLARISKKKWFMDIGWTKRIHPHVENLLRAIKDYFSGMLKAEKHKYSMKIIAELERLIERRMEEHSSLKEKLDTIRLSKNGEEQKLWSILTFGSNAQIKVKSDLQDIQKFYQDYLQTGLGDLAANLRKRLINWESLLADEILKEIWTAVDDRIKRSGFDNLTILDAMKDDLHVLSGIVQDCIDNKSSPFIRHAGNPVEDRFFISGLELQELKALPALPKDFTQITSDIEKNKRKMIIIRLSANFSMGDLAPYDFAEKYASAYEESLNKGHEWIHIKPEAIGFEDPLGLSIGMEEESLIRTCLDVGILFQQKGYYIEYKEGEKRIVLAQGLENTIRALQHEPKNAALLKKKLLTYLDGQNKEWLLDYLNDHDRSKFADEEKLNENHKGKYKNAVSGFTFSLPHHKIPSYILKELEKRIKER